MVGLALTADVISRMPETVSSRAMHSHLVQNADAGSVPHSATIYSKPNPYRLGFFLPETPLLARFRTPAS